MTAPPRDGKAPAAQTPRVDLTSPEGFREMYRDELAYVWATVERLGARPPHVEDRCHDVFMTAFRKRHDYDPQRPLRQWLFGIAYRLMLNVRRKQEASEGNDPSLQSVVDESASPEANASLRQERSVLLQAIESLSPERRAAFVMHDLDGFAAPEIARSLEIPLNTVYSRIRLARADVMRATAQWRERSSP